MSRSHQGVVGLCLLVLPFSAPAEEKPPASQSKPAEVIAVFRDGSVLKGVTLSGSVQLTTRYGKLTIPLEDVKRVEFAFRVSEAEGRKIEQAIAGLRRDKEEERAEARRQLADLGRKAIAALEKAAGDKEDVYACRAQAVLQEIRKAIPADQLQGKTHDTVVTGEGVFTGTLAGESLKVRTKTLGEVQFKLTDLRSLHGPGEALDQPPAGPAPTTGAALGTGTGAMADPLLGAPASR